MSETIEVTNECDAYNEIDNAFHSKFVAVAFDKIESTGKCFIEIKNLLDGFGLFIGGDLIKNLNYSPVFTDRTDAVMFLIYGGKLRQNFGIDLVNNDEFVLDGKSIVGDSDMLIEVLKNG